MPDASIAYVLDADPKHLVFTLARYKFVAKMFAGMGRVLEVGCGNGFGARIVAQAVGKLDATDEDTYDILTGVRPGYDGVYLLDVFEHIADEATVCANLKACAPVCIIGTPSRESQVYASKLSIEKHVNCKSGEELRELCKGYWKHVFMFGMNDETLHTGFLPMSHYLIALCVEAR